MDSDIIINNFTAQDIDAATRLSINNWGGELAQESAKLRRFVFEGMVRYYYRNSNLSVKAVDDAMQGLLLAFEYSDDDASKVWFSAGAAHFNKREQEIAQVYHDYLLHNGQQLKREMGADDVLLGLFLSRQPGCGKRLLQEVAAKAEQQGKRSLYLWADATCDYDYYGRHGFKTVAYFENKGIPLLGNLATYIYRRDL